MFCLHEWVTLCAPFCTPLGCTTGSLAIFTVLWDLFQYSSHLGSRIKLNSVFLSISYVFCLFNGSLFAWYSHPQWTGSKFYPSFKSHRLLLHKDYSDSLGRVTYSVLQQIFIEHLLNKIFIYPTNIYWVKYVTDLGATEHIAVNQTDRNPSLWEFEF